MIRIFAYCVFAFMVGLAIAPAFATRYVENNYYTTEVTETTITSGVSDNKLSEGLTLAAAGAGHQFDYSTQDWQASIVGSVILDESADAVSFGIGKRFEQMDVLWHGSFTRSGDTDLVVFGGTWRF